MILCSGPRKRDIEMRTYPIKLAGAVSFSSYVSAVDIDEPRPSSLLPAGIARPTLVQASAIDKS